MNRSFAPFRRVLGAMALAFSSCLALAPSSFAAPGDSAGIVVYHRDGDRVFLLLADHPTAKRGWGGFGGGREKGETPAQAAARETEEETRGFFKSADMLAKIKDQKPVIDGDFALFFAEVEPVETAEIAAHPIPDGDETYRERGPWAWVPFAEVLKHLKEEPGARTVARIDPAVVPAKSAQHFWPVWLRNMWVALKEDALPWLKEPSPASREPVLAR
jgi:8-oxo-dGTP pyrophosphatase MutT (NUDIX family)